MRQQARGSTLRETYSSSSSSPSVFLTQSPPLSPVCLLLSSPSSAFPRSLHQSFYLILSSSFFLSSSLAISFFLLLFKCSPFTPLLFPHCLSPSTNFASSSFCVSFPPSLPLSTFFFNHHRHSFPSTYLLFPPLPPSPPVIFLSSSSFLSPPFPSAKGKSSPFLPRSLLRGFLALKHIAGGSEERQRPIDY